MTEPTARERARAITWSHASAPWSQVEHEIEQAILAAEAAVREPLIDAAELFRARAIEFEAKVAALREVLGRFEWDRDTDTWGTWPNPLDVQMVLVDTAASAEAYTARIREKAAEEERRACRDVCLEWVRKWAGAAPQHLPATGQWYKAMAEGADVVYNEMGKLRALATPPATEEAK